jgi:hypothetical protein
LHLSPDSNSLILPHAQASLYGLHRASDGREIDTSPVDAMKDDMDGWEYVAIEVDIRIRWLNEKRERIPNRADFDAQLLNEGGSIRKRNWVLQWYKEMDPSSLITGEPWPRILGRIHCASVPLNSRYVAITHRFCRHV